MMTLPYVLHAMVKELTWMDLYVGSAEEMAKLPPDSTSKDSTDTKINKSTR